MKQTALIITTVAVVVSVYMLISVFNQANEEKSQLSADLQYRTHLLSDSLKESVEPAFAHNSTSTLQKIIDRFANRERLVGLAVFDNHAISAASSGGLSAGVLHTSVVAQAMDSDSSVSAFETDDGQSVFVFADPLHENDRIIGAFLVVQDASFINASVRDVWLRNLSRLLVQVLVFGFVLTLLLRWLIVRPLSKLTESVRSARVGDAGSMERLSRPYSFFPPLAQEISKMSKSLLQARVAAREEARMRLEKLDSPWTAERLRGFMEAYIKDRPLYVVSNREPYVHEKNRNGIHWSVPASGMVTALEPVMAACGGVWLAHGSGSADRDVVDENDSLRVPPDDPKYTLKRIWLSDEDIQGYYVGFSNEALWPLCHMAHTRPIFRKEDWVAYRRVNGTFAKALLEEIKEVQRPLVLVQDYQFALLAKMIKDARPDAHVAVFWHIPWPSAELFSICPWRKEILEGMLGADLIGFHTQQYCNNFLDTVAKEIEALVDLERFAITREGHTSYIKPFPISIGFTDGEKELESPVSPTALLAELGVKTARWGVGVDRLDYTKGILERFKALEFFFERNPEHRGKFTFLQIAPPSREGVQKYREYNELVSNEAERINQKFLHKSWKPIVLEKRHFSHAQLEPLYRSADMCIVSSLHDGMNLVAKEYVAARNDEKGVLILSQLTGAARDLKDALRVNPYNAEQTAEAILQALTMPPSEQRRRMKAMRESVKNYNVFRWSAELIKALAEI